MWITLILHPYSDRVWIYKRSLVNKRACPRSRARSFGFLPYFVKIFFLNDFSQIFVFASKIIFYRTTDQIG